MAVVTQTAPKAPQASAILNLAGGGTREGISEAEENAPEMGGIVGALEKAFNTANSGVGLYQVVSRAWESDYDPNFDLKAALPELTKGIPAEYHDAFKFANSQYQADGIRKDVLKKIDDSRALAAGGIGGVASSLVAGVLDVDMLVNFGSVAAKARKMNALSRVAHGAATGAATAMVSSSVLAELGDGHSWSDVPTAMMMGSVFGGVLGGLSRRIVDYAENVRPGMSVHMDPKEWLDAMNSRRRTDEFSLPGNRVQNEWTAAAEAPRVQNAAQATQAEFEAAANAKRITADSIDAKTPDPFIEQANQFNKFQSDPNYNKAMDQMTEAIDDHTGARVFVPEEGRTLTERSQALLDSLNVPHAVTGWLKNFSQVLDTPVLSDLYKRLWNSSSPTAKAAAVSLFESAEGFLINNRSAAAIKEHIFDVGYKNFTARLDEMNAELAHAHRLRPWQFKERQALAQNFSEEVIRAANDLRLGRDITGYSPQAQRMLEHVKDFSEYMRKEARGGVSGGRIVPGFENVKASEAYIPLNWSGEKLRGAILKYGRDKVESALTQAYKAANPEMSMETATAVSRALLRRGEAKGTTIDTNLHALLQGDGKTFLKQALIDNGMDAAEVESLMTKLSIRDQEKGIVGNARHRTDIDLSGTFDGIRILDLVDSDLDKLMYRYSDTMSKKIALARHGIDSDAGIENIKNTIIDEMSKSGAHSDEQLRSMRKVLDHGFGHFQPGSVDKDWNPWYRRAKQATNLALLSKLGLAQLAETGAIMAHAGVQNFVAASPVFRGFLDASKKMNRAQVLEDLGWMTGNLGYEKGILNSTELSRAALDHMSQNNTFVKKLDDLMQTGQKIQSEISGYRKVMEAQMNTGACAFTNKVFRKLRDEGYSASDSFWRNYGITGEQAGKLKELIDDGTIKFTKYGHVDGINPEKWDSALRESYGLSTMRAVYQMVQRPLAGETVPWLGDATVGILGHLQTFPLLSMKKQFMRNAMRNDGTLEMLTLYGIGTASVAGAVRNFTEGKEQTVESISKAALSYSNSVGWTTLGLDPMMTVMGLGQYAPGGKYAGEFNIPMLSVASNALKAPKAAFDAVTPGTKFTKADKRSLQVIPVVGSMYGMGRLLDTLVNTN